MHRWLTIIMVILSTALPLRAERIKDIVGIQGVRGNPLVGYGLVVGLQGSGDDAKTSRRALASILRRMGLVLDPGDVASKNIASVMVTAELGPFDRQGSMIDVTVSSIGNASSLLGGTLLMTPLVGADGQAYAVAQGHIMVGGFNASGDASSIQKNHTTVGRIPAGATVEREELAQFIINGEIRLQLKNSDFTTAGNVANVINKIYPNSSYVVDAGCVRIGIPQQLSRANVVPLIARIGALEVQVDMPALVVINEKTGTIVVGKHVGISKVGISHGSLTIITEEKEIISQALPFSRKGTTEKTPRTEITVIEEGGISIAKGPDGEEQKAPLVVVPRRVSVSELAKALNAMGLTPRDLISIFQALRQAGALQAQLKIM